MMLEDSKGISNGRLDGWLDLQQKSARPLCHRIRDAKAGDLVEFAGPVETGET